MDVTTEGIANEVSAVPRKTLALMAGMVELKGIVTFSRFAALRNAELPKDVMLAGRFTDSSPVP